MLSKTAEYALRAVACLALCPDQSLSADVLVDTDGDKLASASWMKASNVSLKPAKRLRSSPCFIQEQAKGMEDLQSYFHSRYDGNKRTKPMNQSSYLIKQLASELDFPESGKRSIVLADNNKTKAILFTFAAGAGLAEHIAPFDATIQIISGAAALTVGDESVEGKPGTWIQMAAKTSHGIKAETPVVMLLTLVKSG